MYGTVNIKFNVSDLVCLGHYPRIGYRDW